MPCLLCGKENHPELEGVVYDPVSMVRVCWLYANDPYHKALVNGVIQPPPQESKIDKECVKRKQYGPGTALKEIIAQLELGQWEGCQCEAKATQMNVWGVEGCKEHRAEIVGWMQEAFKQLSWMNKLKAAKGLAFSVNLLDPVGSLVDEAILRAKKG